MLRKASVTWSSRASLRSQGVSIRADWTLDPQQARTSRRFVRVRAGPPRAMPASASFCGPAWPPPRALTPPRLTRTASVQNHADAQICPCLETHRAAGARGDPRPCSPCPSRLRVVARALRPGPPGRTRPPFSSLARRVAFPSSPRPACSGWRRGPGAARPSVPAVAQRRVREGRRRPPAQPGPGRGDPRPAGAAPPSGESAEGRRQHRQHQALVRTTLPSSSGHPWGSSGLQGALAAGLPCPSRGGALAISLGDGACAAPAGCCPARPRRGSRRPGPTEPVGVCDASCPALGLCAFILRPY